MELTEENQDFPDCMPPRESNSIEVTIPDWMQQLIEQRQAKRAAMPETAN
jgi:hypothetical protein